MTCNIQLTQGIPSYNLLIYAQHCNLITLSLTYNKPTYKPITYAQHCDIATLSQHTTFNHIGSLPMKIITLFQLPAYIHNSTLRERPQNDVAFTS